MSEQVFIVKGANDKDLQKRHQAFETLAEQPTDVLDRLVELSKMPTAVKYLKNPFLFATMKGFLKAKS